MPPPEVWGPPIWTFFHVLAEKIREREFPRIYTELFSLIQRICAFLPCPDCSQHAISFLKKIKINEMNTKEKFKGMLYVFHNYVNLRKHKKLFNYENLVNYRKIKISYAFNNFVSVYNTKGNMKMLSESFQRSLLLKDLRKWLMSKFFAFDDSSNNIIQQNISINKEEIIENTIQQQLAVEEKLIIEENVAQQHISEEHISEKPLSEKTISEQLISEEPLCEQLISEETVSKEPLSEQPISEEKKIIEDSVTEKLVTEEVVTEEVVTEEKAIVQDSPIENLVEEESVPKEVIFEEQQVYENKQIAEENIISLEEANNPNNECI